jgi:hypothetical protein
MKPVTYPVICNNTNAESGYLHAVTNEICLTDWFLSHQRLFYHKAMKFAINQRENMKIFNLWILSL